VTKERICNLGYEQMKLFVRPHVYLWLASEGWEKCFEIEAVPLPDEGEKAIGLHLTSWKSGGIIPDYHPN
jgi:hypothetical protein